MTDISWEKFDELKKLDLMVLEKYFDIEVKHAMHKQLIKIFLIDRLVEDDLFDETCFEKKIELEDGSDSVVKLKQLEIKEKLK